MPLRRQQSLVRLHTLLFITVLIFTVSPLHAQTATTLYTFTGGLDGKYPQAALIRDCGWQSVRNHHGGWLHTPLARPSRSTLRTTSPCWMRSVARQTAFRRVVW